MIKWLDIIWACAISDPLVHPTRKDAEIYVLTSVSITIWLVAKLRYKPVSTFANMFEVSSFVGSLVGLFHSNARVSLILPVEL